MDTLYREAKNAGVNREWQDAGGERRVVADDDLRAVLDALGGEGADKTSPPLITAWAGGVARLNGRSGHCKITLESGGIFETYVEADRGVVQILTPAEPGYHRLEFGGTEITLALAPRRAYTLQDAGAGKKLWGLAVQLYALRRKHDGGIGDFQALAEFTKEAAALGAAAVALSPAHALFTSSLNRYAPYAPSSRVALNVLHIARDGQDVPDALIDWPRAAARKLLLLRGDFEGFCDWPALDAFRASAGQDLERHALFEALCAKLGAGCDWRAWPLAYRDPASAAVRRFAEDNAREVAFHAWLQWRAAQGLQAAQHMLREAGAKIGLISDLAVGTSPDGSHAWSRQGQMLKGLEIGAPPDVFNREGQGWGITGFSPQGLRGSGFSVYLEMLRHALQHAGGVRIDHVMGLMRLWVVPLGRSPAHGAYLAMPFQDLLRLTVLESWRHKAVVLGEDLGTLPPGLRGRLSAAGIAGMRVLWFERRAKRFTAPARWAPDAVAMTTTHDLPTVAGWWTGTDIAWRNKLGKSGEGGEQRATDRGALWAAFCKSGAAVGALPESGNAKAATQAAAAHVGGAACALALLPVEDALCLPDAPNLPGTTDEHPNWRRRLPGTADEIFGREDVRARLTALNTARRNVE
ncbi:MAG: 4-alpha-glucanotransferase [Rhodospirillales bacterium]|nr:4-alpha-glucanotransferase [Rhodospirillales bacterium]